MPTSKRPARPSARKATANPSARKGAPATAAPPSKKKAPAGKRAGKAGASPSDKRAGKAAASPAGKAGASPSDKRAGKAGASPSDKRAGKAAPASPRSTRAAGPGGDSSAGERRTGGGERSAGGGERGADSGERRTGRGERSAGPGPRTARTPERIVKLRGPFWTAEANLLGLEGPEEQRALRTLLVDLQPRSAGNAQVHLPGTVLLLVFVRRVVITLGSDNRAVFTFARPAGDSPPGGALTPAAIRTLLLEGKLALLVCSTDPARWTGSLGPNDLPEATVLLGDVGLDLLPAVSGARSRLYAALALGPATPGVRSGAARLVSALSVHGSGLTLFGKLAAPWEAAALTAPFQLARELPDPAPSKPRFRLTLEERRFTAEELAAALAVWDRFARLVDPGHPSFVVPGSPRPPVPRWATLEVVNPGRLPRLYWELTTAPFAPEPRSLPVKFERGEIGVILADQDPRDSRLPPTALARITPESVELVAGAELQIRIASGPPPGAAGSRFTYQATRSGPVWTEEVTLAGLSTAFDPIEAARRARAASAEAPPVWDQATPVEPPVLWQNLKLEDGWAQLPVPNLTEQAYLDAGLAVPPTPITSRLEGAASFGNDKPGLLAPPAGEQPWSVTVLDAGAVQGTFRVGGAGLARVDLVLHTPEVVLDGLFWFGTEPPTVEDALPDLADWRSGLRSLPLTTVDPTDSFPAPVRVLFDDLTLRLRPPAAGEVGFPSATLAPWSATYEGHAPLLKQMVERHLLPADLFARALPLVWRRHPRLPMVQALPLTQNQIPPSFPSASRQLVPFELPVVLPGPAGIPLPLQWRFGTDPGQPAAGRWPRALGALVPAREWQLRDTAADGPEVRRGADLPLVALSLPGLQLAPSVEAAGFPGAPPLPGLVVQYRHDLPYADQVHALAQLPRLPRQASEAAPPAADPGPAERPRPLLREDLAGHFARLAERAALAAADQVGALAAAPGGAEVHGLAQPAVWPVSVGLDEAYPGTLALDNASAPAAPLALTGEAALRGIEGAFVEEVPGRLRRLASGAGALRVTAGGLAAQQTADGQLRDQRGLLRAPVRLSDKLTRTRVKLVEKEALDLTSALSAFELAVAPAAPAGGSSWRLWFRDLPVQGALFDRATTLSPAAQDVNDPEARSRTFEPLTGYEWRLAGTEAEAGGLARKLFGLDFFPLTLDRVEVEGDELRRVEITGRLQLPTSTTPLEDEDLTNAVRLVFLRPAPGQPPALDQVVRVSPEVEWPLSVRGAASADAPRLRWREVQLSPDRAALEVRGGSLAFSLFEADWVIPLQPLVFAAARPPIRQVYQPASPPAEALAPAHLTLDLDLQLYAHQAALGLALTLGPGLRVPLPPARPTPIQWRLASGPTPPPAPGSVFRAEVTFALAGAEAGSVRWTAGALFDDLPLPAAELTGLAYLDRSLQFRWSALAGPASGRPQVLPGMALLTGDSSGFAALAFDVAPSDRDVPLLPVRSSLVEALLPTRWGQFLQQDAARPAVPAAALYGSSAGDLVFGYTAQSSATTFSEALLANGMLEVKNLVSWPLGLTVDEARVAVTLPATRLAPPPPLSHLRHSLRVLLDQHVIPAEALHNSPGDPLFTLAPGRSWQFLAVVEHQLLEVVAGEGGPSLRGDRRFTAVQEVRLLAPASFKNALLASAGRRLPSPSGTTEPMGEASFGWWGEDLRRALTTGTPVPLDGLGDALLVEASAPLLLRERQARPVAAIGLQFLPSGTQTGSPSSLDDFNPGDPAAPPWSLLALPFLGRIQDTVRDGVDDAPANPPLLQVDPVLQLERRRAGSGAAAPLPPLLLALTSRGDARSEELRLSALDGPVGQKLARLDPLSVEESWFRLQAPASERPLERLESVLRSLPDSPARLGRPAALARLRDPVREAYPPRPAPAAIPEDELAEGPLWRPRSLLVWQAVANREPDDSVYGLVPAALQLAAAGLLGRPPAEAPALGVQVAVALLPTNPAQSPTPQSLALAPFVRIGFRPAPAREAREPRLLVLAVELLCLDETRTRVVSAARHAWQNVADGERDALVEKWARESHRLLCPGSPIAVVRERGLRAGGGELVTELGFRVVTPDAGEDVRRRLFKVRAAALDLRFRDGHFGGSKLPTDIRPFELAPPLVTGVQPLHLAARPTAGAGPAAPTWSFGWSGLRYAWRTALRGLAGRSQAPATLWWQSLTSAVQFRSTLSSRLPAAGFPAGFRARAIAGLLPVLPRPPLPAAVGARLEEVAGRFQWQPVLPGGTRALVLGQRPGVTHAARVHLLRQSNVVPAPGEFDTLVSGSVPVQHRAPRPVSLPPADAVHPERALQPWASAFAATTPALVTRSPADEAYFAGNATEPPARLQLRLVGPERGLVTAAWDGRLSFAALAELGEGGGGASALQVTVRVALDGAVFDFATTQPIASGTLVFSLTRPDPARDPLPDLRALLAGRAGAPVALEVRVARAQGARPYFQSLSFPLRFAAPPTAPAAPLEPIFVHFEDPEYNRALASSSRLARLAVAVTTPGGAALQEATVAADRHQYNPGGAVVIRYDGSGEIDQQKRPRLALARLQSTGALKPLTAEAGSGGPDPDEDLSSGSTFTFSLDQLREAAPDGSLRPVVLAPGDVLQVKLRLSDGALTTLDLPIVEEPQVPVPQAAFALLRRSQDQTLVECVRFAWMPAPARIELVDAEDLRVGLVRRRAVFHLTDSGRVGAAKDFGLQKITTAGATHLATFLAPLP